LHSHHDQLSNGQKFRALTVVDVFSREALTIEVGHRLGGEHVVEVLNRLVSQRGAEVSVRRQRRRVLRPPGGSVGLSPPGPGGLLPAGQADYRRAPAGLQDAPRAKSEMVRKPTWFQSS